MPNEPINPNPNRCGGLNEPACPPQPALDKMPDGPAYSFEDMLKYGHECYQKGRSDAQEAS